MPRSTEAGLAIGLVSLLLAVPEVTGQGISLVLEPVVAGLARPLAVVSAGDGSGRLFIAEQQTGKVLVLADGEIRSTPFLDVGPLLETASGEQGLLGLVFDPDFETNGFFYVQYTEPEPEPPAGCPIGHPQPADCSANSVVARYRVSSADPNVADPGSATVLLRVNQERSNHNGGHLAFGSDGSLYIGLGDGGGSGDPYDNAQDRTTLAGSILRIDPDGSSTGPSEICGEDAKYGIPVDNPFAGADTHCDEIWSYGLRNPWRFSFDRETGDLWVGDVGQGRIEEIDLQLAASTGGENYGWSVCEGSLLYPPPAIDPPSCSGPYVDPVFEYPHTPSAENPDDFGRSVTGGHVYRGSLFPKLRGVYLYADFIEGKIWGSVPRCDGVVTSRLLLEESRRISTFGEDEAGELYVADFISGGVLRLATLPGSDGPEAAVSPTAVDFGALEPGEQAIEELLLRNVNPSTNDEALLVSSITVTDPAVFQLDVGGGADPCGSSTPCLAPGESCTVEIVFTSASEGFFDGTLAVDGNTPAAVATLTGISRVPCTAHPNPVLPPPDAPIGDARVEIGCFTLTAGPYEIAPTGVVIFRAGELIELRNGFLVRGSFTAEIEPLLAVP